MEKSYHLRAPVTRNTDLLDYRGQEGEMSAGGEDIIGDFGGVEQVSALSARTLLGEELEVLEWVDE